MNDGKTTIKEYFDNRNKIIEAEAEAKAKKAKFLWLIICIFMASFMLERAADLIAWFEG